MDRADSEAGTEAGTRRVVRHCLVATVAAVALMGLWSAVVNSAMPTGAAVPIHWNAAGEADGFASKGFALTLMPATALGIGLLLALIPVLDPRKRHIAQSMGFLRTTWLALLLFFLVLHLAMGLLYLGWAVPMDRVVITSVGGLFVVLGNLLGKVRSNFFMGVRTPWTLSSEYTWTKTNRATGRVMVGGGVAIAICGALWGGGPAMAATMLTVGAILIVAVGYSYAVWRTAPDRAGSD